MRHHVHRREMGTRTHHPLLQRDLKRVASDCEEQQRHADRRRGGAMRRAVRITQSQADKANADQQRRVAISG